METNEQIDVEYMFLTVTAGGDVVEADGKPIHFDATLNSFSMLGWRFVAVVRTDTETHHPVFLMQREGK